MSENHELGLMGGMVTTTQNDMSPGLLAHVRRGPCARPTERERFEFMLGRKDLKAPRPKVQEDPAAAEMYQHTAALAGPAAQRVRSRGTRARRGLQGMRSPARGATSGLQPAPRSGALSQSELILS